MTALRSCLVKATQNHLGTKVYRNTYMVTSLRGQVARSKILKWSPAWIHTKTKSCAFAEAEDATLVREGLPLTEPPSRALSRHYYTYVSTCHVPSIWQGSAQGLDTPTPQADVQVWPQGGFALEKLVLRKVKLSLPQSQSSQGRSCTAHPRLSAWAPSPHSLLPPS